jgi:hypothetical protein
MKKVAVLVSTCILFASLTFAQTPQTTDKGTAAPAKKECTMKKDGKACTGKEKAGCCDKKGTDAKGTTTTKTAKTPEKK